jgi:hypothetical protein
MSSAATALIWWVVPAMGLIGGLGYVLWISKFQEKFQQETQRSVGQFQRFQDSLRTSQARDIDSSSRSITGTSTATSESDSVNSKPGPELS